MFLALVLFSIPFLEADASCSSFVPVVDNILAYNEASVVFFGTRQSRTGRCLCAA